MAISVEMSFNWLQYFLFDNARTIAHIHTMPNENRDREMTMKMADKLTATWEAISRSRQNLQATALTIKGWA